VLIGERNNEDSKRKASATAARLKRAAERGDWAGGPVPDGYRDAAGWQDRLVEGREVERARMRGEVNRATAARGDDRRLGRRTAEWERWIDAENAARADISLDALERARADRARAQRRLRAAQDAYAAVLTDDVPADTVSAVQHRLRAALAERMNDAGGDVKRLNAVLREYFDGMDLLIRDDGAVEIRPILRPAQLARFLDRGHVPDGCMATDNPHTRT
jgi:hypothetical protein